MTIDYDDLRKASTPNGIIGLLSSLGHEPVSDWDGLVDIREIILDDNIPNSIRSSVADDALTIRELSSLVGEQRGIECYGAILRPGFTLSSAICRNLSHAFRNVSSITRIDETFLFIGVTKDNHTGPVNGETEIIQWATIHLSRVYRKAGSSEELRLSRLDWKPTKKSRHTLDCLKSLQVDAYPGQVDDTEVERFKREVKEWFNKEKLSRRFFREFYKRFECALDLVQRKAIFDNYAPFLPSKNKPITSYTQKDRESDSNRQNAGKFMLKQILRLLFLHYLQEKEWLCKDKHFLINQWRQYEKKTRSLPNYDATTATGFHSEVLIPLFFETLNRRRPDDALNNWATTRWDKGDRELMPYLNGGIFEIDKVIDHWNFHSEKPSFLIPDAVFSADRDYEPALDDESLSGRQVNLLAFLDDYNFTIAEDTPVDEAVALDPELMGKIFENLLVSRHSDGAYYTPRSIVRFQCKDTLARYLEEQLGDICGINHDWLLTLFDLDRDFTDRQIWDEEIFTPAVADRIEAALRECKVLDPSVGSGAYLLGMLTEMLRLRQLCHKVRTGHMVDRGSIEFYRWKSEIIRDSLYGVDINPQAVAICHLRLWLSMAVDQSRESASPLPNLDFQVTAGDSLRDSINGRRIFVAPGQGGQATLWSHLTNDDEPNDEPIQARIERIRELRLNYYDENATPSERNQTRTELQSLRGLMMLEGLEQLENYELKQLKKLRMNATKRDKLENDIVAKFNDARKRIQEGSFTSIFSYEAIFGDVFQRQERSGFDIIIGNPPYLEDTQAGGGYRDIQDSLGLGGNQMYGMFWKKSIDHLARIGGQISFITSDALFTSKTHQKLRECLLKQTEMHYCIKAGHWFFTFNNNWTCIMTVTKNPHPNLDHKTVYYDISKLPNTDGSLLIALDSWKEEAVNEGDLLLAKASDGARFIDVEGETYRIGRYLNLQSSLLGLPWMPFFHTSLDMVGPIIHDETERRPRSNIQEIGEISENDWRDQIPRWIHTGDRFGGEYCILSEIATIASGITTGGDQFYVYSDNKPSLPDVPDERVISDEEIEEIRANRDLKRRIIRNGIDSEIFEGRTLVPYDKPTTMEENSVLMFKQPERAFFIDWSETSVSQLRNFTIADNKRRSNPDYVGSANEDRKKGAQVRNDRLYFSEGIAYSQYGEKAPQFWPSHGTVFAKAACLIISDKVPMNQLLCLLGSHPFRFIAKAFYGNMSNQTVGSLQETPVPLDFSIDSDVANELIRRANSDEFGEEGDEYWRQVSASIGEQYGYNEHMMDEVFVWLERTFSRPGDTVTPAVE